MKKQYDFSKAKRSPYARRLKRQVTIRLDHDTIGYFQHLSDDTGIPYQTLINLLPARVRRNGKAPLSRMAASRREGRSLIGDLGQAGGGARGTK